MKKFKKDLIYKGEHVLCILEKYVYDNSNALLLINNVEEIEDIDYNLI